MCRGPAGSCDLPEYCTGASPYCPANVYLLDGSSCQNGKAYCYNGMCLTHEQQCLQLWGYGARPAHDACFEDVNAAGNAFGNCGKDEHGNYKKCEKRSREVNFERSAPWFTKELHQMKTASRVLERRYRQSGLNSIPTALLESLTSIVSPLGSHFVNLSLQSVRCHSAAKKPKGTNAVSIDTTIKTGGIEFKCRGTYVYSTQDGQGDLPDPGLVMTGTKCGEGKVGIHS
ncbi:hypothetical protein GOODEAATRI_027870 [Goodea atripinnis]|uniref:ADAM cysteine-rich domain-containing protein n=1 Tax=Goodea atripinnis TaxID=208336 RepID=A0ABV0PSC7_9TELE